MHTLQVRDLACRRGERLLFEHLDFELQSGELLLIEGQNGCGKTTLLKTLASIRHPDSGDIRWNNHPTHKQREEFHQQLFWLGHHNAIKGDLTAVENLRIQANLQEVNVPDNRIWDALDTIGLYGYEDLPTKVLSQGQKRRVALAGFLLTTAKLWILDEPFSALDVRAVDLLQSILRKHVEQGGMVILTTHQEVALMSDQIKRLQLDQLSVRHGD